jgi:hypothetical protein
MGVWFAGFVQGLGEVGFQELHVMTHSMGVRVLMAAIPQLETLYGVGASSPEKGAHFSAKASPVRDPPSLGCKQLVSSHCVSIYQVFVSQALTPKSSCRVIIVLSKG